MRVLVLTGAGISAESGIPTFRGAGGYWRTYQATDLATPEAFARDPETVWSWYRERRAGVRTAVPNAAHNAIAKLATHAREFLLLTQNVDDLHSRARWNGGGVTPDQLVQIHGDLFLTRCSRCTCSRRDENGDGSGVPICPCCGAPMRPGVVWFGEGLDSHSVARAERFVGDAGADAVLVIGTTAVFGYIVDWAQRAARARGRIIEVNPDATHLSAVATTAIREPAAIAVPRIVDDLLAGR